MIAYRIVEIRNGQPCSLFHGTDGSRTLPIGKWVKSNRKLVRDGRCSTKYESGFHVLKTLKEAQEFFDTMFRIKDNRALVKCEATGLRRKWHSKKRVYLANRIKILEVLQ